jgi:uncharacterized membrane protein
MNRWLIRLLAVLLLATGFHLITVMYYPRGLLLALSLKQQKRGWKPNRLLHAPRVTAQLRRVVRPSPDLLYSVCEYDVSRAPIRITAPVPHTYWSLSLFAANTDNFFVINDRQLKSRQLDLILVGPKGSPPHGGASRVVVAPTERGVVMIRILITDEDKVDGLVRIQRQALCHPLSEVANP